MNTRYCTRCGHICSMSDKFCMACGASLAAAPAAPEKPAVAVQEGAEVPPQYASVSQPSDPQGAPVPEASCSAATQTAASGLFCRHCGYPLAPGAAYCTNCLTRLGEGDGFCPFCGHAVYPQMPACAACGRAIPPVANAKSRVAAGLLGIFLGAFGVHNFYLGYDGKAIAQLLMTLVGWMVVLPAIAAAIWSLIEGIMLLAGVITVDGRGHRLKD